MQDPPRRPDTRVVAAFALVVVLFGLNFVAVRFSNRELAPYWAAGSRFAVASLLLFGLAVVRRVAFPRGSALVGSLLYGVAAFGAVYAFLYVALLEVPAGMAAVLFATIPLLTLFMAVPLGLERFRWRALAAALVVVAGIAVVFRDQLTSAVPARALAFVLAGAASGAASGVIVKRAPRVHPFAMNAVGMGTGAAMLLALSAASGEAWVAPVARVTWIAVVYLVVSSVIAFALMVWILSKWTASAVSYLTVAAPIVAIVAGALLAGERVSPLALVGGALVLAGVYAGVVASRPAQARRT